MSTPSRHGKVLAGSVLVAAVVAAAPLDVHTQNRMSVAARDWQRQSAPAARTREDRRRQLERARAHARMPSTMYASTPDPAPPHAFPAPSTSSTERPPVTPLPAPSSAERTHRIALFPSASRWTERGYQGFVRITNHSESAGEVHIDAIDDAGTGHGPLTLAIGAGESVHFTSEDLEQGNAANGLAGAVAEGDGDWRLELTSELELEVRAYIRTGDGFLAAMHGRVAAGAHGHRVAFFNPARNGSQVSWLRLVNPGGQTAEVRIEAIDDTGASAASAVRLELPAGAARTVSARELESGAAGLTGAFGPGAGKWRLLVSSPEPLVVMNLLSSPTGHLTNLSTSPANAEIDGSAVVHHVPLFPSAERRLRDGHQGFVRVINRSVRAGTVRIDAYDDEGTRSGPVALEIGANAAVHFNADDLERGNRDQGLSEGIGTGTGNWRLRLRSALELEVLAYIQNDDGFLASVHDLVPRTDSGHRVTAFSPASSSAPASRLRIVNPGDQPAQVRIEAIDERGESVGPAIHRGIPAGGARTVTTRELASGEGAGGVAVGRLTVLADQPIEVVSLLESPAGHLANLSTQPAAMTADEVFRELISGPVVQAKCVNCHVSGGIAGATRLLLVRSTTPNHRSHNLGVFRSLLDAVDNGADYILTKIQGVGHGGSVQVAAGTEEFADMERFLALLGEDVAPAPPVTPRDLFDTVRMASARKTLRRAALIFAGRIPTDSEYAAAERGHAALRATIRGLMTGPQFHEFLTRAANDRLLTDRNIGQIIDHNVGRFFVDFVNETYRRRKAVFPNGKVGRYYEWNDRSQHGFRRAPVELIAHVVMNDRPYTEILTADYIMANPWAAAAYGATTNFDNPEDIHEFKPSRIVSYYRQGEGFVSEYDPVIGSTRVPDSGPLHTDYPHAGILNTTSFLARYPTTATNRNRARSRWTYYHFLGLDIEKSASRTTDPVALADTNNPTMLNPACTVCHRNLDPVAGTFQNYGDEGYYRDKWGGRDSLDDLYKRTGGEEREIRAESWRDREVLSWPISLASGVQTLRMIYTNHFWDERAREGGTIYLDRLRVTDARGGVLLSREFEDVEPPEAPWGRCGNKNHNPATGREDHLQLWGGHFDCALFIDIEAPSKGAYHVEIVAWSIGHDERYEGDGFAKLAVGVNGYREGDTWYRDMRVPGFSGREAPDPDNSVQWLAGRVVADRRFTTAAVKFWWPALMGSEVAEPPEDEGDADFEGRLLAANAQGAEVGRLARGFRGGRAYNVKDLLVEMVLSDWFRADAVEDANPMRRIALRDAGARRLLTPEELARKTSALTGVQWERRTNQGWPYLKWPSGLTDEYRLLYGGIDSDGVTKRARDLTAVMAGVAKRHAMQIACAVVTRDFYLRTGSQQRLLAGVDKQTTAPDAIRAKLVELHENLLGVEVTAHSPDVETAYGLFADVLARTRARGDTWFDHWNCYAGAHDRYFFEGLLDDLIVQNENAEGHRWHDFDWNRVGRYLDRIDWSDPSHTAQAWVVTLAYLLMDYRYLYL